MEIDPAALGTLELGDQWVPYLDLVDIEFLPTKISVGKDEYAFKQSIIVKGHSATLPRDIRAMRAEGQRPLVVERGDRYYVFVAPA